VPGHVTVIDVRTKFMRLISALLGPSTRNRCYFPLLRQNQKEALTVPRRCSLRGNGLGAAVFGKRPARRNTPVKLLLA
jgi:hypothetical protein